MSKYTCTIASVFTQWCCVTFIVNLRSARLFYRKHSCILLRAEWIGSFSIWRKPIIIFVCVPGYIFKLLLAIIPFLHRLEWNRGPCMDKVSYSVTRLPKLCSNLKKKSSLVTQARFQNNTLPRKPFCDGLAVMAMKTNFYS